MAASLLFADGLARLEPSSAGPPLVQHANRAAQYLRASTDLQEYSIANQMATIALYAERHGLEVVRTYADDGVSGLTLRERSGLVALLDDVTHGAADFGTLLVLDVSRWGRFQDCDESACYEYLCRRGGVRVEYCAEPFVNDASPMAALLKNLKRAMAAEYSRELSQKIFTAKCRLAERGLRQGGTAGYGLRRLAVDGAGRPRVLLEHGQRKGMREDRVVLVPGPADEVATVRWIFEQVADAHTPATRIARTLNARGVLSPAGGAWTDQRVIGMVRNEKYAGRLVYNRKSAKLRSPPRWNVQCEWVRASSATAAIIDAALFSRAQAAMARWPSRITDAVALDCLREVLARHGTINERLINATRGMPGSGFFAQRFGGLSGAYARIGFRAEREYEPWESLHARRDGEARLRGELKVLFAEAGAELTENRDGTLAVAGVGRIAVRQPRRIESPAGLRWVTQQHLRPPPDWMIARCVAPNHSAYWLIKDPAAWTKFGGPHRPTRARYAATELPPLVRRMLEPEPSPGPGG